MDDKEYEWRPSVMMQENKARNPIPKIEDYSLMHISANQSAMN
jgi:hypothetical protein